MKTLVLGYGNRSRTDDGVGWFVLERLQELALRNVELLTSHQLDVDHAELITGFDEVIFVDAAIPQSPQPIALTVVHPGFRSHAVAHYLTAGRSAGVGADPFRAGAPRDSVQHPWLGFQLRHDAVVAGDRARRA